MTQTKLKTEAERYEHDVKLYADELLNRFVPVPEKHDGSQRSRINYQAKQLGWAPLRLTEMYDAGGAWTIVDSMSLMRAINSYVTKHTYDRVSGNTLTVLS